MKFGPIILATEYYFTLSHPQEVLWGLLSAILLAPVMLWVLFRSARRGTRRIKGKGKVVYPRSMRALVRSGWVIAVVLPLIAFHHGELTGKKTLVLAICGLGALVLPLHLEVFRFEVSWDGYWIYTSSPWRRRRRIPFSTVTGCDYSHTLQSYRIFTRKSGTIFISAYTSGIPELLELLPVDTPPYPPTFLPWPKPVKNAER